LPPPLPFPTPPFPLPPLPPPLPPPDVGEDEGAGLGVEPPEDPPDEPPAEQAAVLFCQDLPAQSMLEDVVPPRKPTDITITAAISTTRTEYSTEVAPRSLRKILLRRFNMPEVSAGSPDAA